jgi:hypothetical protein
MMGAAGQGDNLDGVAIAEKKTRWWQRVQDNDQIEL